MPTAYVLLNTEIGAESQVVQALRKLEGVQEVKRLWGVYDIIANVKADNMDDLKYVVTKGIEKIGQIHNKLTMIVTEKPQPILEEQVLFEPTLLIE